MNHVNIKITMAYDGTRYRGFQRQKEDLTVQAVLEQGLEKLYGKEVRVSAAGRTDSGVHARGQVINFKIPAELDKIPINNLSKALNSVLPTDVAIKKAAKVSLEFDSRKHAKKKTYRYYCYKSQYRDPIKRNYAYHLRNYRELNYEQMRDSCEYLLGRHDFTAFCASQSPVQNKIREVYELKMFDQDSELFFEITGDGFLYKMVRMIVGTILKIGEEKLKPEEIITIIDKKDKSLIGPTISPQGLFLERVYY